MTLSTTLICPPNCGLNTFGAFSASHPWIRARGSGWAERVDGIDAPVAAVIHIHPALHQKKKKLWKYLSAYREFICSAPSDCKVVNLVKTMRFTDPGGVYSPQGVWARSALQDVHGGAGLKMGEGRWARPDNAAIDMSGAACACSTLPPEEGLTGGNCGPACWLIALPSSQITTTTTNTTTTTTTTATIDHSGAALYWTHCLLRNYIVRGGEVKVYMMVVRNGCF